MVLWHGPSPTAKTVLQYWSQFNRDGSEIFDSAQQEIGGSEKTEENRIGKLSKRATHVNVNKDAVETSRQEKAAKLLNKELVIVAST